MLLVISKLWPFILAGAMSGSYIVPTKFIKRFSHEKIWLYHSAIGLALMPWLLLWLITPQVIGQYADLPRNILLLILFGGVLLGIGQVFFAYAVKLIGIALSFTINLGIGVAIGSLFIVFYEGRFLTLAGGLVTFAVALIIISLFIYYMGEKKQTDENRDQSHSNKHRLGCALVTATGLTTGFQNIVFIIATTHANKLMMGNTFWVWPPFLFAAAIVVFLSFLYQSNRAENKNVVLPTALMNHSLKNMSSIILMGVLYTGSLALYSLGMNHLSLEQQAIGWPTFMISIILAAQTWGAIQDKKKVAVPNLWLYKLSAIGLLILAIVLLNIKISP